MLTLYPSQDRHKAPAPHISTPCPYGGKAMLPSHSIAWLLHFFVFAFDGVVGGGTLVGGGAGVRAVIGSCARSGTRAAIDGFADFVEGLLQGFAGRFDALHVIGGEGGAHVGDLRFQFALLVRGNLVAQVGEALFGAIGGAIGLVALFDLFLAAAVFLSVRFGILHHALDLVFRETAGRHDGDFLLATGALVAGRDVHDTVGIDVEGDFDLRDAAWSGWNAIQNEAAQRAVVFGEFTLALQDVNLNAGLVVAGSREDLALLGRNGGVALDQLGENAAQGLDTERERRDVEQQHVFDIADQHSGLNGRANGYHFVRVDAAMRVAIEDAAHQGLNGRHAGLATNQDDFLNIAGANTGIGQCLHDGATRFLNQVLDQLLHLRAGQGHVEVLGAAGISRNEGQVDFGLHRAGKLFLGLLGGLFQALQGHAVLAQVDAILAAELIGQPVDNALVEVITTQVRVTVGTLHLEDAFAEFEDGDIEGTTTEVIDGDALILFLVQTVGQRGGSWLVDDAQHIETGDFTGIAGGLALGVVEVGRNGNHGLRDTLTEIGLSIGLELLQDHGGDFGRAVLLALNLYPGVTIVGAHNFIWNQASVAVHLGIIIFAAHEPLDRIDSVFGIGDSLALGNLTNQALTIFINSNDRGGGARTFGIRDNDGFSAFHYGDTRVGRSQIDSNYFSWHSCLLILYFICCCNTVGCMLLLFIKAVHFG